MIYSTGVKEGSNLYLLKQYQKNLRRLYKIMCKLWKKELDVFHAVMTKAKRGHQLVSIFVKNGYRISGYVIGIDENTVLIEGLNGDIQMVRIDAISTVAGIERNCVPVMEMNYV